MAVCGQAQFLFGEGAQLEHQAELDLQILWGVGAGDERSDGLAPVQHLALAMDGLGIEADRLATGAGRQGEEQTKEAERRGAGAETSHRSEWPAKSPEEKASFST